MTIKKKDDNYVKDDSPRLLFVIEKKCIYVHDLYNEINNEKAHMYVLTE